MGMVEAVEGVMGIGEVAQLRCGLPMGGICICTGTPQWLECCVIGQLPVSNAHNPLPRPHSLPLHCAPPSSQSQQLGGLSVLSRLAAGAEERDHGERLVPTQLLDRLLVLARQAASQKVRAVVGLFR